MILFYYPYDFKCDFFSGKNNRITIEDKDTFERFVCDLDKCINGDDESFYMENTDKEINLKKATVLITSPLDLRYNKREYQRVLYNRLSEEVQINGKEDTFSRCFADLLQEVDWLCGKIQYNLEFDDVIDYSSIFKLLDISLEQPKGTFAEKLLEYMSTQLELMNRSVFFVVNCSAYLDEKWYDEIVKWCAYQNVFIIFVESKQEVINKNVNEYILDKDICEIH